MIADFYLMTTKNLGSFLQTITNAQAPSKFTTIFLEQLGFKSTTDRLFIKMLKGLGFLDANGAPTDRYYQFLDGSQSKFILADSIREAYSDLFQLNIKANEMNATEIKNKLKTLFQGKASDDVLRFHTNTFKGLCDLADFTQTQTLVKPEPTIKIDTEDKHKNSYSNPPFDPQNLQPLVSKSINTELHYNIQIHLPETKDVAVYDAIFESLKRHLL